MTDKNELNFDKIVENNNKDEILKSTQRGFERAHEYLVLTKRASIVEKRIKELGNHVVDRFEFIEEFAKAGIHDAGTCKLRVADGTISEAHLSVLLSEFESIQSDIDEVVSFMLELGPLQAELLDNKVKQQILSTPAA